MIAGEGTVFIIIICLGAFYVIRSYYSEISLAKKEKNFALSVTHELKTPIASSKLFAETLLQRQDLTKSQVTTSLEKIVYEQNRLNELVEKILLVSTIDEMKNDMNLKPVSFNAIINQVIGKDENSHVINNTVAEDVIFSGDDFYLISLFQNLLDNAKKYSPDGSEINIYSESNSSKIIICISDQGVGIAEDEKSKIFDRFYRIEDEETRSSKGTGLGLFLVNQIVKMHGGKIICKNNTPRGSIFELHFKK
jgi:signal transduction histidine kinase